MEPGVAIIVKYTQPRSKLEVKASVIAAVVYNGNRFNSDVSLLLPPTVI